MGFKVMSVLENLSRKDRCIHICELVNSHGELSVAKLSELFCCSEETIRRDLRYLESLGRIVRTFGGASTVQVSDIGKSFEKRKEEHVKAKLLIAEKASRKISPSLTIFLDGSSSCYYLAKCLPKIHLKVVTNSIRIITVLKDCPSYEIICTGGQYDVKHGDFTGNSFTNLNGLRIDFCFTSCVAADLRLGIFDMSLGNAAVKAALLERSHRKVLLADTSKYGKKTPFKICTWDHIDYVIDDGFLETVWRQDLHKIGINII